MGWCMRLPVTFALQGLNKSVLVPTRPQQMRAQQTMGGELLSGSQVSIFSLHTVLRKRLLNSLPFFMRQSFWPAYRVLLTLCQ